MADSDSTQRASHPVGITVKVTYLFHSFPVRKQDALKNFAKVLAKIKRTMQEYALARPMVRFQLRVLKAKTDKGNFNYAPKADANVEDAVFKVVRKNCASQCDWTVFASKYHEFRAFLPKPDAIGAKVAKAETFISVDARLVSCTHGTLKKLVTLVKDTMRKANPSVAAVKDPFICLNIVCPPDSYDPNIEPAKEDVLFADDGVVIEAVTQLIQQHYPHRAISTEAETTDAAKREHEELRLSQIPPMSPTSTIHMLEDVETTEVENDASAPSNHRDCHWRFTMYGRMTNSMRTAVPRASSIKFHLTPLVLAVQESRSHSSHPFPADQQG